MYTAGRCVLQYGISHVELLLAPISPQIKAPIHNTATRLEVGVAQGPLLAFGRKWGISTPRKEEGACLLRPSASRQKHRYIHCIRRAVARYSLAS